MSKLVIVESPAKARTISKFLGSGYEVRASMGHVRDLRADTLAVDVKNDFRPTYTVVKGKEKLIKELTALAGRSSDVYLATDPDREGEAISWHLAQLLGLDVNTTKRVKFNEINKKCVTQSMAAPEKIDLDLVNAQQARRILDRIVGYRLSPFISQKIRRGLSAGRVQSVAVRLICDREDEIRAFVPEEYWSVEASLGVPGSNRRIKALLESDENGKVKIGSEKEYLYYKDLLEDAVYTVASVKKGVRRRQPAPPFITSTLQQEASKRLGFPAKRTMKVAQELYEGVDVKGIGSIGLITYMRTDSLRISEESRAAGNEYIKEHFGEKYLPEKPRYYKSKGSNVQDGHEAIRPSNPALSPEQLAGSLTNEQLKLYSMIWRRFLASLMANCVQDTIKAQFEAATPENREKGKICVFGASGYSVKFDGYTVLYDDNADEEKGESNLGSVSEGEVLKLRKLEGLQHFTQPPARYTEASLIKMLEDTGVGRPSTYASIISTVLDREYVVREQKSLKPTELGETTNALLKKCFPKIVNTKFTAGMETQLDEIEAGKEDYVRMLQEFYDDFENTLSRAKDDMQGQKLTLESDKTDIPCPNCGRMMMIKVGRFGKFLACPGYPECRTTMPYVETTEAKCPVCGSGDVVGKRSKKGYRFYGCSNWPDCSFVTWDKPSSGVCPDCGSSLFTTRGGVTHCLREGCGYTAQKRPGGKKSGPSQSDE
ncbi:MAG: type I DNA topoisomerase [Clostridia bacterium]|nr:type I DNA topoisomerase [Clostridia bacterium]